MTDDNDHHAPAQHQSSSSDFFTLRMAVAPVALWLIVQAATLALSCWRVPLWGNAPQPAEHTADAQMIVVQIVMSSLLFPWLLRDALTTLAILLSGVPMLLLAGMLSETPWSALARVEFLVALWIFALASWSWTLRALREELLGVAIAILLTIGPPVVRYLGNEFSHDGSKVFSALIASPISAALAQLHSPSLDAIDMSVIGAVLLSGVGMCAWMWQRRIRQVIHSAR